jgi:hypothetical protein
MTQRPPSESYQNLGFLPLLIAAHLRSLLHPEHRRAPANKREVLLNSSSLGSCTERGRIRFLGSASHECPRSSTQRVFHPTLSPHGPTAFVVSSSGGSSSSTLQSPQYIICDLIYFLSMYREILAMLFMLSSMLDLCMLVPVFIMIYFIRSLIL